MVRTKCDRCKLPIYCCLSAWCANISLHGFLSITQWKTYRCFLPIRLPIRLTHVRRSFEHQKQLEAADEMHCQLSWSLVQSCLWSSAAVRICYQVRPALSAQLHPSLGWTMQPYESRFLSCSRTELCSGDDCSLDRCGLIVTVGRGCSLDPVINLDYHPFLQFRWLLQVADKAKRSKLLSSLDTWSDSFSPLRVAWQYQVPS